RRTGWPARRPGAGPGGCPHTPRSAGSPPQRCRPLRYRRTRLARRHGTQGGHLGAVPLPFETMTQTTGAVPVEQPDPPVPAGRGRLVSVVIWTVVAGFALWAVVRLFGLEHGYPFIQLVSFTPYVAVLAVPVAVVALLLHRWPAAAVAGLVTVALAWA